MSDELTPREKELLAKLPRERMPLGLEGRVVEAMRDKGFLAKRRRMIEITNSRVASLIAACVVLIIGAYAIGLHRGGGDIVLPPVTMTTSDSRPEPRPVDSREKKTVVSNDVTETEEESPARESRDEERHAAEVSEAPAPAASANKAGGDRQDVATPKAESPVEPAPAAVVDAPEKTAGGTRPLEEQAEVLASGEEAPATPPKAASKASPAEPPAQTATRGGREESQPAATRPSPQAQSNRDEEARALTTVTRDESFGDAARDAGGESAAIKTLPLPQSIRDDLADRRLTFLLNGTPVTVEADSARVVEDERGRILIVYTPDGIMRLRLGE